MKGKADPYKFGFANNSMEYKLEELFDLQMGKTPSRSNADYWNSNDNKWISISDLSKCEKYINDTKECISNLAVKESGISLIPENTVIMSFKLSIGKTAITAEPIYSNEAIMAFVDKNTVDLLPDYVYYLFSGKNWSEGTNKAVKGTTLNKATLSKVKVRIHDIDKQRIIVSTLDKLQSVIAKRKQQLEKLDQLVKARFVEMFGEPIDNPMGWQIKQLKDLSTLITNGNTPKGGSENYVDSGIIFLRSQNVWRNRIDLSDVAYIDETTNHKMRKSIVKHKDILITKTGRINTENSSLGRAALYLGEDDSANINGHVYLVRLNDSVIPEFVVTILTGEAYRKYIRKVCVGGIDKRQINLDQVEDFPIILPPIDQQRVFADFSNQINKSKVAVQKALDKSQMLFDSLMQEYFG